ncbi:MAG: molybdate ABC transporter substrate-binding protein [Zetaproteobacteria bacterium CG1_02_49_23]|nr:MAG: molybdate ABC transporter substrate-binding protein [Zetaproteobacteria bacterium CG1_02_49_23]
MMKRSLLMVLALLGATQVHADEVSVAVAANFTDATRDIIPLFEQASGHTVKVSFGSTGKLYAQIENGAPFEVFLAADSKRPEKAEAAGLAVSGSRFTYAMGKLALWSSQGGMWSDAGAWLKAGDFQKLAIANPKTAPYGLAAEQVMQSLGMWDLLQSKLVQGDSIAQTFQFVASGNARAGFVAGSQVYGWQGDAGTLWEIPQSLYEPIRQQAVLLAKGNQHAAAEAFLEFLKSDAARAVIVRYGYGVE